MPAYFDTGFSVREPMWHGEGIVLDEYPTDWQDARTKAGLLWEPEERPAFNLRPTSAFRVCLTCEVSIGGTHASMCQHQDSGDDVVELLHAIPLGAVVADVGVFVPVPDHKLIVRNDTDLVLGVTSDKFNVIYHQGQTPEETNRSMGTILDAFVKAGAKFETAGSCREGRMVWTLLYLDEPYEVPGDSSQHIPFVALLNPHDGTGACKVTRTQVRVVCWNTCQAADLEGQRSGLQFVFRHTGNVADRIEEAKAALAGLRSEATDYIALAKELMDLRVDDRHVSKFLSEFLPSPKENGEVVSDRVEANVDKARKTFRSIYTDSITTDSVRGTGWGLLQASTEYLDHARAYRTPDTYLGRSILRAEPAKAKALSIIRSVCK